MYVYMYLVFTQKVQQSLHKSSFLHIGPKPIVPEGANCHQATHNWLNLFNIKQPLKYTSTCVQQAVANFTKGVN